MPRVFGWMAVSMVLAWVVSHLPYLGPVRDATETTMSWVLWLVVFSGIVAALAVVAFGRATGSNSPAWFQVVMWARAAAAVVGWLGLGLLALATAGIVHWSVVRTERRTL